MSKNWQKNAGFLFFGAMCDRKLQILVKVNEFINTQVLLQEVPCGLMARIAGFHPAGPGSIPGMGELFFRIYFDF